MDGKSGGAVYIRETGGNRQTWVKSHLSTFKSKKLNIRKSSAFYKHLNEMKKNIKKNMGVCQQDQHLKITLQ